MNPVPHILIIGGGVAGLVLATKLGEQLGRTGRAHITLVDRSSTHIWKPMLHTIAAGTWDLYQQQVSYIAHASEHHFNYQLGKMCGLDRQAREVHLGPLTGPDGVVLLAQRTLPYDILVLAIGSQANDFGVAGVAQYCHFIDNQAQAEAFNLALRSHILRCVVTQDVLRIAIVGAGATGVELAAEISRMLELASHYGDPTIRQRLHLTLLESGPRILAAFPEQVSSLSAQQLLRIGVDLRVDTPVVGAEADGFRLGDGQLLPAALMVWAAGVKGANFVSALSALEVNRHNQLLIRPSLQAVNDPQVFVLGDCASLVAPSGAPALPPTAQVAAQQAEHLARHLAAWLDGTPVPDFIFHDFGSLVSLSQYNAFGTLGKYGFFKGGFVRGWFAQLSHTLLYRRHQIALHGVPRATLMWLAERLNGLLKPRIRLS